MLCEGLQASFAADVEHCVPEGGLVMRVGDLLDAEAFHHEHIEFGLLFVELADGVLDEVNRDEVDQPTQVLHVQSRLVNSRLQVLDVLIFGVLRLENIFDRLLALHEIVKCFLISLLLSLSISQLLYNHQPTIDRIIDALNIQQLSFEPDVRILERIGPVLLLHTILESVLTLPKSQS